MEILIETERLLIRELLLTDDLGMFEMETDPAVHYYVEPSTVKTIEDSRVVIEFVREQYLANGIGRWAVIEKGTNDFIGWLGFKLMKTMVNKHIDFIDFGYRFKQKHWGKGFATEGSKAVLDFGFKQLGYKEVYAMTNVGNLASRRVLEKVGFSFDGLFNYETSAYNWQKENEPITWYKLSNPYLADL